MFMPMFKTAIFLVIISCCCFYPSHGCLEEERTHLLQIKDSINFPHDYSLDEDWVGKNCCNWSGIKCNSSSFRVISISLYYIREERLGLWYPNASLFAAFKELEELVLWDNHIGGWVAPQAFSKMQSLRKLDLWWNNLSASIDSLRGLCELKNLQDLNLDSNNLDGRALPPCLSNLSMLETLALYDNDLGSTSSALTGLCELKNLRALYLDRNNLDGRALPPCLSNLSKLEELSLSSNDLGSYSSALTGLCGLSALKSLDLSTNYFNDSNLPRCMGNFSLLENLYLARNNLSGHFGNSISGLKRLQELDLDSNLLTDEGISTWISNLTSLTSLSLEYNKLKESDTMRGLKRLKVLHLRSNHLTDDGISPWISNLTTLTWLNLGNNKLKGSDTMIGFCKFRNLEALDIEENSFECSIHPCFGAIPFEKQFSTFKESSYAGNHDLCGQPLQWNCSSNNRSQTQDGKGEEEDNSGILDHPMFFYLLVTISYALGFWSFIALICNKNRRQKLFRIVDRYYD